MTTYQCVNTAMTLGPIRALPDHFGFVAEWKRQQPSVNIIKSMYMVGNDAWVGGMCRRSSRMDGRTPAEP